jgi:hypothetical protein
VIVTNTGDTMSDSTNIRDIALVVNFFTVNVRPDLTEFYIRSIIAIADAIVPTNARAPSESNISRSSLNATITTAAATIDGKTFIREKSIGQIWTRRRGKRVGI